MPNERTNAFVIEGKMALPYQYFAGAAGSRFIVALRDEKKILAVRSAQTGKTFIPPRQVCDQTFERLDQNWVEVGPEGVIMGFTVIRYREPYQPKEPPYVLALIKLDGADTAIAHVVEGIAPAAVRLGMRVRPVFSEERTDNFLAIRHFEPA